MLLGKAGAHGRHEQDCEEDVCAGKDRHAAALSGELRPIVERQGLAHAHRGLRPRRDDRQTGGARRNSDERDLSSNSHRPPLFKSWRYDSPFLACTLLPSSCNKRVPTLTIVSITGTSSFPSSESAYSTDGGDEGVTVRITTFFFSRSRSRAVSILGEMPAMSR